MSRTPLALEAVIALSPDDSSTKAARGLVSPGKWPLLGASDAAVWGECQGSGSKPYQTQVDVSGAGPTFKCSCPSRKFPCKHGLALLLLQAQDAGRFTAAEPAWVAEWLASRKDRAEKKEIKAATPVVVDTVASAKRETQRWQRMAAGAQELALWLDDLCSKGLAALSGQSENGASMAARMVDAQAPGLKQRLTLAMALVGQGGDWPSRLLERLGNLQLLVDAALQRERLPEAMQADLRQALGWPLEREDVLALGGQVTDQWRVVAHVLIEREARLTERRVWLHGAQSSRRALLLDFSYAGKAFEQGWIVGQQVNCSLAFYPGADPVRALLAAVSEAPLPESGHFPEAPAAATEWTALADRVAANPWAERWPLMLGQAQVQHQSAAAGASDPWRLRLGEQALPLVMADADGWLLMAFAGGAPVTVFGEWDGAALRPLSAWAGSQVWAAKNLLEEGV
jgi:hypothetical protein